MKKSAGFIAVAVLTVVVLCGPFSLCGADQPEVFTFKYVEGVEQQYKMNMKMDLDMNIMLPGQPQKNKMTVDLNWNIKLTPKKTSGDITRVVLAPEKPEMSMDMEYSGMRIVGWIKGGHVYVTQNGQVIIDTKNNIGMTHAADFTKDMAALSITGELDLSADGRKVAFFGSDQFTKFWNDAMESQVGFFSVFFPQRAIAVGDNYSETLNLKKMGQVILDGEGLVGKITLTREPDKMLNGTNVAVFKISSPLNQENLVGSMQNMPGARVNVKSIKRNATGYTHFDNKKGELLKSFINADADVVMSASMQGQSVNIDMKLKMVMDIAKL